MTMATASSPMWLRAAAHMTSLMGVPVCPYVWVCVWFFPSFDGKMKSACGTELGLASFLCLG